jgi:hypothetical protein
MKRSVNLKNIAKEKALTAANPSLKVLSLFLVLVSLLCVGCASKKKAYFYHPNKTPAGMEADYAHCMRYLGSSFNRERTVYGPGAETWYSDNQGNISGAVERCMKGKGYTIVSEEEAKELGIRTDAPWPPYAETSSSTGP